MIDVLSRRARYEVGYNQRQRDAWVASRARSLPHGTKVLDVGAGTGRYRHLFGHCVYRTQDFGQYEGTAAGIFRDGFKYTRIDYVSDAAATPVPDGSFDAVVCTEVLEHVPEPIPVVREIGRVLRVGGRAFVTAPLASALHQEPYHFYGGYTPHFYRKFMPEAGLRVVSIEPNGGFFRHLLQEVNRAGQILLERKRYQPWHPAALALRYGLMVLVPLWLARLDDAMPLEQFTIGYHVEAVRE